MKLTHAERLRRAVAEAARAAGAAHTAAWRLRKKMEAVREVNAGLQRGSLAAPIRAFADLETARQHVAAMDAENSAWTRWREALDLAEFLGAPRQEDGK